jgi:hypothetical protein
MFHTIAVAVALVTSPPALSVDTVEASLQTIGSRATINRYFSCDDAGWPAYSQIETGDQRWLNLAVRLLDESDACVHLSLTSSIAAALPRAPSRVLKLLDTKPALSADRLCVRFLSSDDDPRADLRYLRTVEATLIAYDGVGLRRQRDICLREVRETVATITRLQTKRKNGP